MAQISRLAIVVLMVVATTQSEAQAQGRRGGMVGNRGGGNPGFRGSPSFSGAAGRPAMGMPGRPANVNPGNLSRPASGVQNRPGSGGIPTNRPSPGGIPGNRPGGGIGTNRPADRPGPNPGTRPGGGGIGDRPPFGGIGNNQPGLGGGTGNRPNPDRPPLPGLGANRPGGNGPSGGLIGSRPGGGGPNRPGLGDNLGVVNRPNIGNNVNRPINSGNTNINRPINNVGNNNILNRPTNVTNITNNSFTNVNRGGYGGWGYGGNRAGWGQGPYGYGGYRPNPYAAYHAGWVNGFWNGNYARGWGGSNWGWNALGLGAGIGIASWGLGSLWSSWGYSSFVNPYFMPSTTIVQPTTTIVQPVVYDYSQPLNLSSEPPSQSVMDQAVASLDSARAAFQAGDYPLALKRADQAIQQSPNDPTLHEFRAICLFAMGRYDEAAVPMYTVLSAGPGWDWTTLAGLYPSTDIYTQQLRALEAYCTSHAQAASARFLLASLYMTQGDHDAAAGIFKQVVALQPRDQLSAQLLAALTPSTTPASNPPAAVVTQPENPANPEPSLPAGPVLARLVGAWTAAPARDVAITLTLDAPKGFQWKVTDRGQSRQFQGVATFDNEILALTPPDQPPMVGTVTWKDDAHFQFKAVGAPPDDPGLTFQR